MPMKSGIKSELFDRLLRVNAAVFYYDYRNIQVSRFELNNIFIYNGAAAEIYGIDIDLELRPARGLTIDGGLSLLHDRFTSFPDADRYTPNPAGGSIRSTVPADGNRLPITADATFNLNVHYDHETKAGTWSFDLGGYYNSGFYRPARQCAQAGRPMRCSTRRSAGDARQPLRRAALGQEPDQPAGCHRARPVRHVGHRPVRCTANLRNHAQRQVLTA